ncbi:MAG: hypothetical protein JO343_03020 [Candidatus Eremiobacteraeota bacterium]|nr:hypothetical protein [Candidatus Eremiobacteraeota bacterium]
MSRSIAMRLAFVIMIGFGVMPLGARSQPNVASVQAFNVQLVGHSALYDRGMNAALAIYDHYVYVGNRTDSSSLCVGATGVPAGDRCPHPHPGILIVDIKDPAAPTIVGEIGKPDAGNFGITTRELRVWPNKNLLIVMDFRCSTVLHACTAGDDKRFPFDIAFFDLSNPLKPRLLSKYIPTSQKGEAVKPHEMFLWVDPKDAGRALLYLSTPTTSTNPAVPNVIVADISGVSEGRPAVEVAEGNWNKFYPGTDRPGYPMASASSKACGPYDCNLFVHSMGVSVDGSRAYLAMEAGQFLILDTSAVAKGASPGKVLSLNNDLLTQPANRPIWGQTPDDAAAAPSNCSHACPNGHSEVKVPGRPLVFSTDEVYGTYTDESAGCPWGWARLIDVKDEAHPTIVGEYKTPQDAESFCGGPYNGKSTEQFTSYSSHNPTVLQHLAVVAWHSGGLQIIDIDDPANPRRAGFYLPTALDTVATEDPALGRGPNKVIMWSYPIIRNGLIYVVDVRNGLYILRYTGAHAHDVSTIKFLEGNSNLGDAGRLEQ